jgi:DHA2 family multidrug resistance protein-like MFS transporter
VNARKMRRWWALGALSLAVLAFAVDATVLNLALPTLAGSLHASNDELQWFVDAYSLVVAAMLLPAGLLGDRFGRRRTLLAALVVFGAASLGCAYAPSASAFIVARIVLGLGAAFLLPLALAVLPVLFSDAERPGAIAVLMGTTVAAYPIGPLLGGWLLTHLWWGSVFLVNVPVVGLALAAVATLLPESRSARRPGLDPLGVVTSSAALVALTGGVIEAGTSGWGGARALAPLGAGVALLAAFVAWERRLARRGGPEPLVDLGMFRSASFSWGTILATVVTFAMFGLLFTVPQYLQAVRGLDPQGAGVRLLPLIAGLIAGAALADRLVRPAGAKVTVAAGFALMAAGLIVGATTTTGSGDRFTAAWTAVVGLGLGFVMPAAMDAALGTLSADHSGVGAGLVQAVRQVGGTFGVAILGSVLNAGYRARLDGTALPPPAADAVRGSVSAGIAVAHRLGSPPLLDSVRSAFVAGMDSTLWVCGGIAVAGVALALAFLPDGPRSLGETREPADWSHDHVA